MKKALALALAFVLTVSLVPAGMAEALHPNEILGIWYLSAMEINGVLYHMADLGQEVSMNLLADNSAALYSSTTGDALGSWVIREDVLTVADDNDDEISFILVDSGLYADKDGQIMFFNREKPQASNPPVAPVRSDAVLAEFNGVWELHAMEDEGIYVPRTLLPDSFDASLAILDGKMEGRILDSVLHTEGTVSEGALCLEGDAEGEKVSITLHLHENGIISIWFSDVTALYFSKTDDDE
ncbi:MAG: hypothetical protein FWF47_04745 [Clostridia bacterium]|nr:hypothetical protein [Clostridia bacterium]